MTEQQIRLDNLAWWMERHIIPPDHVDAVLETIWPSMFLVRESEKRETA